MISGGLAIWAAAVAFKDWRSHRVPNAALLLLLVPALLALIVNGKGLLGVGVVPSILGLLVAGGILLPGYALGKMGAGDVKLAGCMGLLLGPAAACKMLLVAALVIGALSVMVWVYHRNVANIGKRRIPVASALAVGFILQLFAGILPWSFFR